MAVGHCGFFFLLVSNNISNDNAMESPRLNLLLLHVMQKDQDLSRKYNNPTLRQGPSPSQGEKAGWTVKKNRSQELHIV